MTALELIGWAVVELQGARPDMAKVREALERALVGAAGQDVSLNVKTNALIRLSSALGDK